MLDLIVIGAGLSGLFAAYTAAKQGLSAKVVARGQGAPVLGAGTIDALGYFPDDCAAVTRPLETARALARAHPGHPYALVSDVERDAAFDEFLGLTSEMGLPYGRVSGRDQNLWLPSAVGAARPALFAPLAQMAGDLARREPMLIVGLRGLRDFYPEWIAENLNKQGHPARAESVPVELVTDRLDFSTVQLAEALDRPERRAALGEALERLVHPGERVGLPALLGSARHAETMIEVEEATGAPVFEIPMLPPSIPGIRLTNALRAALVRRGVRVELNLDVTGFHATDGRVDWIQTATSGRPMRHSAGKFILASGGILSGGITIDADGSARETVFDLPVKLPARRSDWFHSRFFDPAGHPIFTSGVNVDSHLQPVGRDGVPVFANVYAAGTLLANADPIRERSLEGIALVTGRAAALRAASR